jgi:hypothetical protein
MINRGGRIIMIASTAAAIILVTLFGPKNHTLAPSSGLIAASGLIATTTEATTSVTAPFAFATSSPPKAIGFKASSTPLISQAATFPAATLAPRAGKELGVWVWMPPSMMSVADMQQAVNEAAANHFNAIYITLDDYFPISESGTAAITAYEQTLTTFLSFAAQKNIAVDAEAGSRSWGQNPETIPAAEIILFVTTYNQSHAVKFRGVQLDIEPYLFPNYETKQPEVLANYVSLINKIEPEAAAVNLPLTIVLPYFFDQQAQWTPQITVDGVTNYTYNHILRILNRAPKNRIIIMAYRNTAGGLGGSIAISKSEIASADATRVRVIIAQETGPVTPNYVTFAGLTRGDLATQAANIENAFANDISFGGIAVDYLTPFLNLSGG